jgi:cobalt-zinc-cadmium efflux system outer membrane protein
MSFSKARAPAACTLSACLLLLVAHARAAGVALTLPEALEATLAHSPELATADFALAEAQARLTQAGLKPNPEAALELENFAGSGEHRDTRSLETTLALSQVIELGGKRSARVRLAEADRDLADIDRRAQQLDVLAEATRRFVDAAAAERRRDHAMEAALLARQMRDAINRRVEAARSPVAERSRAMGALVRAEIELAQAESEARAARHLLASSWGEAEPRFSSLRADLFRFEPSEAFPSWFARIERNPALLRFAGETRLRTAELRLAEAQARPNLTVSLGVRRFEAGGENALVAGASIPLAFRDRNQGAIAEARARLAHVEAERTANLNRLRASLFAIYQEMEAARLRATRLRDEALPAAREALTQTRAGYERGRFSFLDLASAQAELLEIEREALQAAADHHRLRTELERLTGEAMS